MSKVRGSISRDVVVVFVSVGVEKLDAQIEPARWSGRGPTWMTQLLQESLNLIPIISSPVSILLFVI